MKKTQQQKETVTKRNFWQRWITISGFLTLLFVSSHASADSSVIGKVVYVDGDAIVQQTLTMQGSSVLSGQQVLQYGDEISTQDLLKTLEGSLLKIEFIDGAEITLRPDSNIFIEKYNKKEAKIEIIKGGIRVITGKVAERNPELYKVITYDGVVTARDEGSDFSVRLCGKDCDKENKEMAGPKMKTDLPVIAKVVAIKGEVVVGNKYKRTLGIGHPVYSGEHLVSAKDSYAQLQFVDGSSVSIQAESAFDISKYRYNETGKQNSSIFKLLKGGLRFVTGLLGKQNPSAFKLKTRVVTMGLRGTDFGVNIVGKDGSGDVVSHVFEGSINQSNESGTTVVEAGSYSSVSSQQSSPVVTATAPATFDNNIAPEPSAAHMDTNSLFGASATGAVESGTYASVKQGEVSVAGSNGKPVTVSKNLSSSVGKTGSASKPVAVSIFQVMDPTFTASTPVAMAPPAPTVNTIIIGGPSGSVSSNAAAGTTSISTIVIQEQTIASPYIYR